MQCCNPSPKGSYQYPDSTGAYEDFHVQRGYVQQWLEYLRIHHPTFSHPEIQIDNERIQQLPKDGLVHDQLLNLTTSEIDEEDTEEDQGPPEDGGQPATNLHSNGFVPDLHITTHEIDQLQNAAHGPPDIPALTMPVVHGTPLSEHGSNIAINAFPTLFPTGKGGFDEPRQHKVSEKDWA